MRKHGIYQRETGGETVYEFYWMGELVNEVDFNERLTGMTKSVAKDLDWMAIGMSLKENLKVANEKIKALQVQNDEYLVVMNDLHSLLSLVLHRHLPKNLDSLEKDIAKSLSASDVILRPWWQREMRNLPPPILHGKPGHDHLDCM